MRRLLIGVAVGFLGLMLIAPLALVFKEAFAQGLKAYGAALTQPDARAAIKLTLLVAVIAVPLNTLFGLAASWAIGKFRFRGRGLLITLIDLPFVARQLVPLMESQGAAEEEAAVTLGASGWQLLRFVVLPKIRWGLFYGVILCNARTMGEFGAVSVVSGHIRGVTNTLPLHVEILYNEYEFAAAFAVASLLTLLALVTLVIKSVVEWRSARGDT